ncbi:MAG: DUF885 domain-containing protein, partial [Candidatus Eisenbacteria bacterium]|nr:DUF885 domain-containing protein [Candidatus Eisenbacteria bacterium]
MDETTRLSTLFEREWEASMERYPTWASGLGDRRYNDQWEDQSLGAIQAWSDRLAAVVRELDAFDSDLLTPLDRLNRELLRLHYANEVEEHQQGLSCLALNQRDGPQ